MKRKGLRVMAAMLAAMLLAGMAGCSKQPGTSGTSSGGASNTEENVNLQGMEIVFAGLPGFWIPEDETSEKYEEAVAWKEEVEKHFNCKIRIDTYAPWDTYFQKVQDMTMQGDHIGDVITFDTYIYPKAMLTGILSPLQDVIDVKDYSIWEQAVEPYFDLNGDIYAVSRKSDQGLPLLWMAYNKTLFEEKGLSAKYNIQELVMNKQWTWDIFSQILKDSTLDTNGDGTIDIWGLGAQGMQFGRLTNGFVRANGAAYTKKVGNNVELAIEDPRFLKAMEYMHQLTWQDKVISTEEKWRGYDSLALFAKGGAMFYGMINWWISTLKAMTPDGVVMGVVPYPIGPDAGGEYSNFSDSVTLYGMPSTTKNKKEAGMVFEYWIRNAPKDETTIRDNWADMVYDTESLDVIEMLAKLPRTLELSSVGYPNLNNFILGEHGITEKIPPATYIEQIKDPIVAEIKQMWDLANNG